MESEMLKTTSITELEIEAVGGRSIYSVLESVLYTYEALYFSQ